MNKTLSFFFHYSKPLSREQGMPVITIHWKGKCLWVNNLICDVYTKGRINNRQPYFVMCGKATSIEIKREGVTKTIIVAHIT